MSKKLLSICIAVVLVAGLISAIALPASANHLGNQPPPASFLPDDDGVDSAFADVLSDRFDGVDQRAHLTLVGPQATDRAEWYVCPSGFAGGDDVATQAELAQCTLIGTDTTGVSPVAGGVFTGADEAYDFFWDIPTTLDTELRDILTVACAGAGTDIEGAGQNCLTTNQRGIILDDAGGGTTGQSTSGEIVSICTDTAANCGVGATTQGTPERAVIDARFRPFRHGDPIPNTGLTMRASTSADLAATLFAIMDHGSDANNDPQFFDSFDSCSIIENFADRVTWECVFSDGQVIDNSEMALWLEEQGATGEGFCIGSASGPDVSVVADEPARDCILDSHYHASTARQASTTVASFQPNAAEGTPPPNAGCEVNETPDKEERNPVAGNSETIEVCFVDQFGNPFGGQPVTFESTGPSGTEIESCAVGGVLHDHDANGLADHCHATTNAAGIATAVIDQDTSGSNPARPGDQVVVACIDPEFTAPPAGTAANQPANHGCATTTAGAATPAGARDTVRKIWFSTPAHVHLVFQGTGSADNPCHTGDTFRENVIGDRDTILACVFDNADNPATTNQVGPTGTNPGWRLQWFVAPSGGGELTATRFSSIPPSQTGADGRGIAELESFRQGNDVITVQLINSATGAQVGPAASIQKRVTQVTQPTSTQTGTGQPTGSPGPGDRTISLEASKNRKTFGRDISLTATISGTTVPGCVAGQTVTLSRTIAGTTQAVQVATGTTDSTGTVSFTRTADQSATWVASVPAAGNCSAATSDGAVVQVRKLVTLKFQPGSNVRRGTRITAIITVAPCAGHEGDKITFWKAIQGVLSKIGDKRSDNNCVARFRRTVRRDSVFQGRSPKSDDDHLGGKSRRKGVNVR